MGSLSQYVSPGDFLLALPIILLTLFAIGVLLIDLLLPPEWKWMNAATALVGTLTGVWPLPRGQMRVST